MSVKEFFSEHNSSAFEDCVVELTCKFKQLDSGLNAPELLIEIYGEIGTAFKITLHCVDCSVTISTALLSRHIVLEMHFR